MHIICKTNLHTFICFDKNDLLFCNSVQKSSCPKTKTKNLNEPSEDSKYSRTDLLLLLLSLKNPGNIFYERFYRNVLYFTYPVSNDVLLCTAQNIVLFDMNVFFSNFTKSTLTQKKSGVLHKGNN